MISEVEFNRQLLEIRPQLRAFASIFSQSEEDAEDLTQDTLIRALLQREKYTNEKSIRAWLFTIMKNIFINSYRRKKIHSELIQKAFDGGEYRFWNQFVTNNTDSKMFELELWNEIKKLDEKFSFPFVLFVKGYRYWEIAEIMNKPIGTIKSRIFYARKLLTEQLYELQEPSYSS